MVFFFITNDSSTESYKKIIGVIEDRLGSLKDKIIHCDLEMSLLNAIPTHSIIQPCYFHYTKTIETKAVLLNRLPGVNKDHKTSPHCVMYLRLAYFLNYD